MNVGWLLTGDLKRLQFLTFRLWWDFKAVLSQVVCQKMILTDIFRMASIPRWNKGLPGYA